MVFGSPKQRSLLDGRDVGPGVRLRRRHLPPRHARHRGARRVAVHGAAGPSETDFVNTAAEGARLMDAVGHPNFVLHLDVKAMSSEPTPVPDIIRQYANRTGHFHANDPNRRGPGFGDVDFVPIFQALKESVTTGWVSVEVFDYTPDPETIAREEHRIHARPAPRDSGQCASRITKRHEEQERRSRVSETIHFLTSRLRAPRAARDCRTAPLTPPAASGSAANRAGLELVIVRARSSGSPG